jgi:hypothetical protein
MRRRKLVLGLATGVVAAFALGAFVLWSRASRLTEEKVRSIRFGMSRSVVEAILGPPGDYTTGPVRYTYPNAFTSQSTVEVLESPEERFKSPLAGVLGRSEACWCSDAIVLVVQFDGDSNVCLTTLRRTSRVEQGPLDNLIWRAKRLWHRWFPE